MKEARKDAGERGGAALARRIVGRLIKTLESFFRKPAGRVLQKRKKNVQRFVTPHVRESFYFRSLFNCSACFDKISVIEDGEVETIFVFILVIITFFNKLIYNSIEFLILTRCKLLRTFLSFLTILKGLLIRACFIGETFRQIRWVIKRNWRSIRIANYSIFIYITAICFQSWR